MSRSISIAYQLEPGGDAIEIEIRPPYYLLGTQRTSKLFWSLPIWEAIGVTRLAELGTTDPVYFYGWEMMEVLSAELTLMHKNASLAEFDHDIFATYLSHLIYCHHLLTSTAPLDTIPQLSIG